MISEIMRQLTWSDAFARLFHYRTRDGEEVAAVIEPVEFAGHAPMLDAGVPYYDPSR